MHERRGEKRARIRSERTKLRSLHSNGNCDSRDQFEWPDLEVLGGPATTKELTWTDLRSQRCCDDFWLASSEAWRDSRVFLLARVPDYKALVDACSLHFISYHGHCVLGRQICLQESIQELNHPNKGEAREWAEHRGGADLVASDRLSKEQVYRYQLLF